MRKIEKRIIRAINKGERLTTVRDKVRFPIGADIVASVWLHSTEIADIRKDRIIINTGGWRTNTTKSRLNAILSECTDYTIVQEDWEWYVIERLTPSGWMTDKSSRKDFADGMSIPRVR
jgi:hypothetical protein